MFAFPCFPVLSFSWLLFFFNPVTETTHRKLQLCEGHFLRVHLHQKWANPRQSYNIRQTVVRFPMPNIARRTSFSRSEKSFSSAHTREQVARRQRCAVSTRRSQWAWSPGCALFRCSLCWLARSCRWRTASCWWTWRSTGCPSWSLPLPPRRQATGSVASVCPQVRPLLMTMSWCPEEARYSPKPRCCHYSSRSRYPASSTGWSNWRLLWQSSGDPARSKGAYETFARLHRWSGATETARRRSDGVASGQTPRRRHHWAWPSPRGSFLSACRRAAPRMPTRLCCNPRRTPHVGKCRTAPVPCTGWFRSRASLVIRRVVSCRSLTA